ncbi:MAG: ATP synthase F1 subunit delta [Dehalococcoidia bacterium]|nr:ATP synthase F1 subunit delta [Dehalococcoidia bacterium]
MQESGVARRYARAAFELAIETNDLDGFLSDLKVAAEMMREPRVTAVLQNVKVSRLEKKNLMTQLLTGLRPLVLNLVLLLITKDRQNIIVGIVSEYEQLVNTHRGIEVAEVITAVPVDEEEKAALSDRLSKLTGKRIILSTRVDPQIMGGVIARIGDRVLDGSLRQRLSLLRRSLSQASR